MYSSANVFSVYTRYNLRYHNLVSANKRIIRKLFALLLTAVKATIINYKVYSENAVSGMSAESSAEVLAVEQKLILKLISRHNLVNHGA